MPTRNRAKLSAKPTHIGELSPDVENARLHTPRNVGTIERALNEVGAARSIVIDENNRILAGNATVEAAALAGIEKVLTVDADGETLVAVRRSGLTEEQKTRLALYDNRAAELAEWNVEQLEEFRARGLDFDGLFRDEELEALLSSARVHVPDVDATPQTRLLSQRYIEIYCSSEFLETIRADLELWGTHDGVTVNIS